jgi:hypothetical protein
MAATGHFEPFNRPAVHAPFSTAGDIRGSHGGDVTIERRRRDTETVCDLGDADVGVGQHRLGSLDVVVGEFWRTADGAPSDGAARLSALPDQAALEFRQRAYFR